MNLVQKLLIGISTLAVIGCNDNPVALKTQEQTGSVSGRIVWDLNGNSIYEASRRGLVGVDPFFYAITGTGDTLTGGGFACDTQKKANLCTISDSTGYFFIPNVPQGTHNLYAANFPTPNAIRSIYSKDVEFSVMTGKETQLGDIKLDQTDVIRTPIVRFKQ